MTVRSAVSRMSGSLTSTSTRLRVPVIGPPLAYMHDPLEFMRILHERDGAVSTRQIMERSTSFVLGPDACEVVLRNADKAYASGWPQLVGPFFTRGLMLLDLAEHHQHRRILQHAFTRERIERYAQALAPAVSGALDGWRGGEEVRVYPALKELTLGIATEIFMGGARFGTRAQLEEVNRAFVDCVQAGGALVRADLPGTLWRKALRGRPVLEDFLGRHLAQARDSGGEDLFSVLCRLRDDDGSGFTDEDVVNHMIFLLMAAHDTSTITATSAILQLGRDPQWQERCREESMALPDHPTLTELEALPSLDLVIKECLRILPPVPLVVRRTVKETEILGHPVPADHFLAVGIYLSHHLPQYWSEPSRFDPERFAEHRREDKSHRYAWEPFGGGVHKCLGMPFADMEVKTILHQVLRRFRWRIDPGYRVPLNFVSLPYPKDGLPVALHRLAPATSRPATPTTP